MSAKHPDPLGLGFTSMPEGLFDEFSENSDEDWQGELYDMVMFDMNICMYAFVLLT